MLAHLMGIRPWEIDLLTVEQFDRAVQDCREHLKVAAVRAAAERM